MNERYRRLHEAIEHCSAYAVEAQQDITRSFKSDGSVLTETDLYISRYIIDTIRSEFPEANIISEEEITGQEDRAALTFVIDPIDGTDVYSQGLPSWCIAVGILDEELRPVGGFVSAPRWGIGNVDGMFLYRIPGEGLMLNGRAFLMDKDFSSLNQLVVCSTSCKTLDFSRYDGKLRSFGSNILHILAPLVFNSIEAAIFSPCYIWDIAAAHALVDAAGLTIRYIHGTDIDYRSMLDRSLSQTYAFVSEEQIVGDLIERIEVR